MSLIYTLKIPETGKRGGVLQNLEFSKYCSPENDDINVNDNTSNISVRQYVRGI